MGGIISYMRCYFEQEIFLWLNNILTHLAPHKEKQGEERKEERERVKNKYIKIIQIAVSNLVARTGSEKNS